MKFSICSEVFKKPIEETLRLAGEIGFDGVEVAPFDIASSVEEVSPERRVAIREAAVDAGVRISGLHWLLVTPKGLHVTTPDDEVRQRSFDYLQALVHFCADIGGEFLILGSPQQRNLVEGDTLPAALERVVPHLRELGDVCASREVHFLLETLDPPQTDFLNRFEDTMALLESIDHPRVNYMLDTRAMSAMPDGVLGNIRKYGARTSYYHANQPDGRGPGMGDFDFAPVFEALTEVGYEGWISTEPFDYQPDGKTVARTALAALKQSLAGDQ